MSRIEPTRADVLKAIQRYKNKEKPDRCGNPKSWWVQLEMNAEEFPLKIIWALASNQNCDEFTQSISIRNKLEALGFICFEAPKT